MDCYLAVDIGGTQLRVALYPTEGITPLERHSISTRPEQGNVLGRLKDLIAGIWPNGSKIRRIGIGVAGPVNPQSGILYNAPNIPEWRNLSIRHEIEGVFETPVVIGNDANLATLGEWRYGAGQGHHDVLYFTISTGIGGGIILHDRIVTGHRGIAAELGHVTVLPGGPMCGCGQRGHLESVSSGPAIARYVSERIAAGRTSSLTLVTPISASDVAEAARQGDPLCIEAFDFAGRMLGQALANYLAILNPSLIILGGGVTKAGPLLFDPMWAALRASVMSPEYLEGLQITTAVLGDEVGLIGALALARLE
jgi:glucokinase